MHLTPKRLISSPPPRFCIAIAFAFILTSCGGGGGGSAGAPSDTRTPFQVSSDDSAEELSEVARRFVEAADSGTNPEETDIDVFGDGSLIVDLWLNVGTGKLVIDTLEHNPNYASLEFTISPFNSFFDSDWNGNLAVVSPAPDELQNANIPPGNPIPTTGIATQKGVALGALRVGNESKLLAGSSEISVDFANSNLDIDVRMREFANDGLSDDTVGIEARDVRFNPNGTLAGNPGSHMFTVGNEHTSGTANPLRSIEGVLNGSLHGAGGQTSVFHGEIDHANGNLIWGAISEQETTE